MIDVMLLETHLHTAEVSRCAKLTAAQALERCAAVGVQAVVITDHFDPELSKTGKKRGVNPVDLYLAGYRIAKETGERLGLCVMMGMELRMTCGWEDYLVYGLDEERFYELGDLTHLSLRETYKKIHSVGALLYQAHPYRLYLSPADPAYLDGVEVYNGNVRHNSRNEKALKMAKTYGLRCIAGSDVHEADDEGRAGIYVPSTIRDSVALADWLRDNQPEIYIADT